ncbi:ATP-binding cassette domain-containing protein [Lujinxingia vulgaris]|uniref:ATP-binding cassette domain-containing protein n=1 Tax=Lujinxingia vulgaris TaxID=2600176 RepID=A0A5C6X830_9DELT|nr:ATP-binding cassette domain-containing protein [Lujinxingia vulgaris]TXD37488.1 ATP-binding cassette domain-containing protein [Lujinxingia vulgaris]
MSGFAMRLKVRHRVGAMVLEVALEVGARPVALIGPNGAGKSTLLKIIAGGVRPRNATIEAGGKCWVDSSAGDFLEPARRRVGYVPQGPSLFEHLRVWENVAFGLEGSREEKRAAALGWLKRWGAEGLSERRVGALSGGEAQRVTLVRALAASPQLLLLDEPLSALDAIARRQLRGQLAQTIEALGLPTIIVTHDWRDVAALGAEVVAMEEGRVVQRGELQALSETPASAFIAEFSGV